eukprot:Clim_evm5s35 gene=Clim_evmTU5s35
MLITSRESLDDIGVDWIQYSGHGHFQVDHSGTMNSLIDTTETYIKGYMNATGADGFDRWLDGNEWMFVVSAIVYVPVIFGVQQYMKDKKAFDLRWTAVAWSAFLSLFSLFGALRTVPYLLSTWYHHGFLTTVTSIEYVQDPSVALWVFLFCLSKFPEYVDTYLIVLRRKPLIFLHWYHHIATSLYCLWSWKAKTSTGLWFSTMNYVVHTIMYAYYAAAGAGIRSVSVFKTTITTLQIAQMFMGIYVTYAWYSSGSCPEEHVLNLWVCMAMYASYAVLFSNFFIQTYILKGPKRKRLADKQE